MGEPLTVPTLTRSYTHGFAEFIFLITPMIILEEGNLLFASKCPDLQSKGLKSKEAKKGLRGAVQQIRVPAQWHKALGSTNTA